LPIKICKTQLQLPSNRVGGDERVLLRLLFHSRPTPSWAYYKNGFRSRFWGGVNRARVSE
jgi:hypothetical protein